MASYFDEHDCEPLHSEQDARTNMLLELARSLFNRMDFEDLGLVVDWDHHLPPPAAKTAVENLPRTVIRGSQAGSQAAAEAPTREPPWSHVHMRWLGRHTSPPQHLPRLPRILIKSFFTHPAAPLLTGLGRDSVLSSGSLLLWGKVVLNRRRYQAAKPAGLRAVGPRSSTWPPTRPARASASVSAVGKQNVSGSGSQ
nr:E3 ubiquitin-protein ligase RNF181 isoform X1 [Globicephala melas]